MSFLNQLKNQARELQTREASQHHGLEENTRQTEVACRSLQLPAGTRASVECHRTDCELLDELAKLIVSQPNRFL